MLSRMSLRITWQSICSLLFVVLWLCPPLANGASADRDKILEGAKKEGRLVLYTGMDVEEANQYTKEFNKKYPFIKPDVFRSSGEKVQARFLVEHRAGVHNADIFQTSIVQASRIRWATGPRSI